MDGGSAENAGAFFGRRRYCGLPFAAESKIAVNIEAVRRLALALPEATEEPHFDRASFRIKNKIFATAAPDGASLNIFVDDQSCEVMAAVDPKAYEILKWGKSAYLHVHLAAAKARDVEVLLRAAWERRAPKKLKGEA